MLRFFVNERQDDWAQFLGEAEFFINNSRTAATKMAPNEILFRFKLRDTVSALAKDFTTTEDTVPARYGVQAQRHSEGEIGYAMCGTLRSCRKGRKAGL